MSDKMLSTYSMWSLFRNCRKACEWRYFRELVPQSENRTLSFGSVIHRCLELRHGGANLETVFDEIDKSHPDRLTDAKQKSDWHLARAMMSGYAETYPTEDFEVIALEKKFEAPLTNPESGRTSRSFTLAGKVDGIVKMEGEHYLLEHKTAARIDAGYLERLWTDFQITLYAKYIEETEGIRIAGVIYNVLAKAKLSQGAGETEAEYEARKADLIAKSKTGKSSAKRKMPESDEDFSQRLLAKYREPGMFHRETILLSRDRFDELQSELWELSQALIDARRRGKFYRNTTYCYHFNRPCAYFPLCSSGDSPLVEQNLYKKVPPHEELREEPATPASGSQTRPDQIMPF